MPSAASLFNQQSKEAPAVLTTTTEPKPTVVKFAASSAPTVPAPSRATAASTAPAPSIAPIAPMRVTSSSAVAPAVVARSPVPAAHAPSPAPSRAQVTTAPALAAVNSSSSVSSSRGEIVAEHNLKVADGETVCFYISATSALDFTQNL